MDEYYYGPDGPKQSFFDSLFDSWYSIGLMVFITWYILNLLTRHIRLVNRVSGQRIYWVGAIGKDPSLFYTSVRDAIMAYGVKGVSFDTRNVIESSIFVPEFRVYYRVMYKGQEYLYSLAPFGKGYVFSYRSLKPMGLMEAIVGTIPVLGNMLAKVFFTPTLYRIDSVHTFNAIADEAFSSVVKEFEGTENVSRLEGVQDIEGLRKLSSRQP
jgi:hypothetical protein